MPSGVRPHPGPTMRDVAQAAGVSKALVSIAFRGVPGASEETRSRIFAAADRIGYRTNRTASLLALARTRQLGLVVDLHNGFHAELADAAVAAADRLGYRTLISPWTAAHGESQAITTALELRCEALLLLGSELAAPEIDRLAAGAPVISIGRQLESTGVDVVRSADDQGMELVVDHLVGLGHRAIAHVDGGGDRIAAARRTGFEQGVRRHRVLGRSLVIRGGRRELDGRRAGQILLRRPVLPTAVAAFNDHCALGVLDALAGAGLNVPGDVSLTGYDDSSLARFGVIDLTSVRQDATELATWAVQAAVERLDRGRTERRERVLAPSLVVRGSSAPPDGRVRTHSDRGRSEGARC